jgi:YjbR
MAKAEDLKAAALSLEGTTEAPHFDRRAFKARRIYATLAADGLTANIRFPPEEQELRCEMQPEAYRKIPNKWGDSGWTTATLSALTLDDLKIALTSAWRHQAPPPKGGAPRKRG